MRRHRSFLRNPWIVVPAAILLAVFLSILSIAIHTPEPRISPSLAQRQPDPKHGAYLAILGDCAACHTATNGKAFAGGTPFPTPVGTVYASNITPDRETGIGNYNFKDFARVMRFGVAPDGARLYPAMPYTAYAKVTDEDLQDLFAYFQHDVAPIHEAVREDGIAWPLDMRWPLALWDAAFHDDSRFVPDPSKGDPWNQGAYIVQGLGHCGTCHTPRGVALEEKDVSGKTDLYLSGATLDGSAAINLRGNKGDGLGRWSEADIAELLKNGVNGHSAVVGPMADAVEHSTQHMTDQDIAAIATYLKSLSPAPADGRATFAASDKTIAAIMAGGEKSVGGQVFMDSCAACHRLTGSGEGRAFPSLAGNPTVLNQDPSTLILVILNGARSPSTAGAPSGLAMPAFGWRYNDAKIAQLATFLRSSWGNAAAAVTEADVAGVRKRVEAAENRG